VQVASLVDSYGHDGDENGFDVLYRTHGREVQRLAARLLRNAADAEDASQTVFLNVLRALRQGVRPAEPRAWLLSITRNVCFSRHRATAARPEEVELDPEVMAEADPGDAPRTDDIVGALARMLPNQRTALILRDFRGVPRDEIAELLTLSPVGVETLLSRARTSFREELEAGDSPFDCAETRALVEQQLAGLISVGERHTLRTHLRHCGPCATLARTIRSSAGKLASLFWPSELFSRLVAALSQAPAAHVVGAVASSALVATVAVPLALHGVPATSDSASGGPASAVQIAQSASAHVARSSLAGALHVEPNAISAVRSTAERPAAPRHARVNAASHVTVRRANRHTGTHASANTRSSSGPATNPAPVAAQAPAAPAGHGTNAPVAPEPAATPQTAVESRPSPVPTRSRSPRITPSSKPRGRTGRSGANAARTRHAPSPIAKQPDQSSQTPPPGKPAPSAPVDRSAPKIAPEVAADTLATRPPSAPAPHTRALTTTP
jgi:RNA polymerase sigma-70 factor (ECF subfamily)